MKVIIQKIRILLILIAGMVAFFPSPLFAQESEYQPDRTSRVPRYSFPTTLEEQEKSLVANPMMQRFAGSREELSGDPYRPVYHFVNPEGTMNDPNGLSFWNIAPMVRIPSPDPYQALMDLDGGAISIIAPYIETADQVLKLAGAVRYKPLKGEKLEHKLYEKQAFEQGLADYITRQNQENILIINIESVPAMEALDEILSVGGLDGILIGPHDLTCSLGIPEQYHHPLFIKSVETIIGKARARHVGVGVHMGMPLVLIRRFFGQKKELIYYARQ